MLTFLKNHTEAIAWLLIGTGIAIVTIFCGLVYANNLGWGQGVFSIESTGQAGSFVGGTAGALWALAGVLFFKSALMLQRESLNKQIDALDVQREELKLQREELRLQREEMVSTRAIFEQQSFETTFFNLLNKFQESSTIQHYQTSQNYLLAHKFYMEKFIKDHKTPANRLEDFDFFKNSYRHFRKKEYNLIRNSIAIFKLIFNLIEEHNKKRDTYSKILIGALPWKMNVVLFYESFFDDEIKTIISKFSIEITEDGFDYPKHLEKSHHP